MTGVLLQKMLKLSNPRTTSSLHQHSSLKVPWPGLDGLIIRGMWPPTVPLDIRWISYYLQVLAPSQVVSRISKPTVVMGIRGSSWGTIELSKNNLLQLKKWNANHVPSKCPRICFVWCEFWPIILTTGLREQLDKERAESLSTKQALQRRFTRWAWALVCQKRMDRLMVAVVWCLWPTGCKWNQYNKYSYYSMMIRRGSVLSK